MEASIGFTEYAISFVDLKIDQILILS